MKHALALFFALVLAAVGVYIVFSNVKQLTTPVLLAGMGCLVLAMGIAIPAQLKEAVEAIKPLATLRKDVAP